MPDERTIARWRLHSQGLVGARSSDDVEVVRRILPGGREAALGMAVVDGQVVGEVRRRVDRSAVRFDLRPWRPLTAAERRSIDDAADRCGTFLGLPAEVVLC